MEDSMDDFTDDFFHPTVNNFSAAACTATMRGESIPEDLTVTTHQFATVRGILHHPGFGRVLHGTAPLFTRALNARSIMSNLVPTMNDPDEFPYCIWYPDTATQHTYRELASRYPSMNYQIGRACAVAGYYNLYLELNLLPDVHIAEEARENGHLDIFHHIMQAPTLYDVMNDYNRTINSTSPKYPAFLNGDTAVTSWLTTHKQQCQAPTFFLGQVQDHHEQMSFNITEDMNLDEHIPDLGPMPPEMNQLLCMPLPPHLPSVRKDLLIIMAAHNGDIDRYSRLRRPTMLHSEINYVVHGIYHSTQFAKWWSQQGNCPNLSPFARCRVQSAIHARFIMNNDLSSINTSGCQSNLPDLIYYPQVAAEATYRELFNRQPQMRKSIARACIVGNYQALYDEVNIEPDYGLMAEATNSGNSYYLNDLQRKTEQGAEMGTRANLPHWKHLAHSQLSKKKIISPTGNLNEYIYRQGFDSFYDGLDANTDHIEYLIGRLGDPSTNDSSSPVVQELPYHVANEINRSPKRKRELSSESGSGSGKSDSPEYYYRPSGFGESK
ncbi:hypothetical protein LTR84_010498 [Exophiala bonariae]|uniref:Uncharacterized protein n=1 Tax=Exophiala bonariae TaxID=1690606 RepID=A0AAV9MSZ8_9EURO|nr:hypothetical protein LTR84_010498 [Exophiala bonariae]